MSFRFFSANAWKSYKGSSHNVLFTRLLGLQFSTSCMLYIHNDSLIKFTKPSIILNDSLIPDSKSDTYEMGLYNASQKDQMRSLELQRNTACRNSSNSFTKKIRQIWYLLNDFAEPIYTLVRFLELSVIFVPVLLLYPISNFGKRVHTSEGYLETRGSLFWYKLLRISLELAGPSFIKLGQWAGSRTDIFSYGFCREVSKLHSNVHPHSVSYSKKKICESLECNNFDYIFEEFKPKPLGIGAIAQVHVGKLSETFLNDREDFLIADNENNHSDDSLESKWIAIKVIHPYARSQISRDLKIMSFFANAIDMVPTMEWLSLPNEVEQFSILMNLQLDLRIECLNLERFNHNFRDNLQAKFPRGIKELSNRDVLFEEYIHAFPMQNFLDIKKKIMDPELCKKVSIPFIDSFLQMLILDDFVHADLHPGNVLIRFVRTNKYETKIISTENESFRLIQSLRKKLKDDDPSFIDELNHTLEHYTPQICFIDTGLVTELNHANRINFIDLFNALARFDGYKAGELMIERSKTPATAIDKELFAFKLEKLVDKVKQRTFTLGTVSIGDLLDQMLGMVRYHHVRLEGDFVSVVVAILLLEGIGRQLDPELDLFERFVTYVLVNKFDQN